MAVKINEDITKSDVQKSIEVYMNGDDFKNKVSKIVKDRLRNEEELEDKIVEITKNVLTQLYKTLWTRRSFWKTALSNKKD